MRRYLENENILSKTSPSIDKTRVIYTSVKYPSIPLSFEDFYVYTTRGDRYDTLAQTFYGDSSLWWIISMSNSNNSSDSLVPEIGSQVRIPKENRIPEILSLYSKINANSGESLT